MLSNNTKNILVEKFNLGKKSKVISYTVSNIHNAIDSSTDTTSDSDSSSDSDNDNDNDSDNSSNITNEVQPNKVVNSYTHAIDTLNKGDAPISYAPISYAPISYAPKSYAPKSYANVHACIYKINTQELHPFIMFLLYKYDDNIINFLKIDDTPKSDLINFVLDKFRKVFSDWEIQLEYKGFIEEDGDIMIIIKYNNVLNVERSNNVEQRTPQDKWWWLLPAEIINYRSVLNFEINKFATDYLLNHTQLFLLYDKTGNVYETPEVGYYGNYYKKIAAVASLGLNRQSIFSSFGPYYYFSDYKHALRNATWSPTFKPVKIGDEYITIDDEGRYTKGGIVKFALFSGRTKMLMGREFDKEDDSQISQELSETNEFVKAMLKLRDSDGTWAKEYNSIRIGSHDVKLKGKEVMHTSPLIALKEYEQQVPLEYYTIITI